MENKDSKPKQEVIIEADMLKIIPATDEDIQVAGGGRIADPISKQIMELVDSLDVNQKIYIPFKYKERIVTYINRTYHKHENNTRYYRVKQVIKNEKYAVIRIK